MHYFYVNNKVFDEKSAQVYLHSLEPNEAVLFLYNWIDVLSELKENYKPAVLVTISKTVGSSPCESGTKMIVTKEGLYFGTIGGGRLEHQVIEDAKECLKSSSVRVYEYPLGAKFGQCCGGKVEILMEPVNTNPKLYIFGAGHIGYALSQIMLNTVFDVHLIDSRKNWFDTLKNSEKITCLSNDEDEYEEIVSWGENTYIIIMSHQHDLDQEIVEFSIRNKQKYIGLIGSRTKWTRFQQRILKKINVETELSKVHCPVGLNVGGETPQEIAISISAELLKTHYGK